jgi:hypothetical protein
MRRVFDYLHFLIWQSGLGYIALWALTLWTLGDGAAVFSHSGSCQPDEAKVLFYWVCDPQSPLSILAMMSNTALTATVWAPVYIAAATVRPDAIAIAAPIVGAHLIGLPAAIFVTMRLMLAIFQAPKRAFVKQEAAAPAPSKAAEILQDRPRALPRIKARTTFGLRGIAR